MMDLRRKVLLIVFSLMAGMTLQAAPEPAPAPGAPAAPAPAPVPAPPSVAGSAWLVMDFQTGSMPVQNRIDERVEPASLTKMMTAYVVAHELEAGHIKLDDMVTISEKAWRMEGSKMFVEVDKQVRAEDLIKGVIIQSGNDASVALAEHIAGSEEVFAGMMNQHAARIGMTGTHFTNSTGWPDPEHYTTARDLALLAAALIRDFPEEYAWHSLKEFTFNNIKQVNRNDLLWRDPTVDGIKTGHTESAGYCLVASALRDGTRVISVVMGTDGSKSRLTATESLINYYFRFYETRRLFGPDDVVATTRVWKGEQPALKLGLAEELFVTVPRSAGQQLETAAKIREMLTAPVKKGSVQGSLVVRLGGKEIAERPLVALEAVPEGSLYIRIKDGIRMLFE